MSNKIVPSVYRSVIDDVIANIKSEFDEYGVSEDVLAELQHKWETKVIQSHVADFEPQPPLPQQTAPPPPQHPSIPHPSYPPHPMHMNPHYPHTSYNIPPPPPPHVPVHTAVQVKQEPMDNRYVLSGPPQHQHPPHPYALPPLAGPQVNKPPNSAVPAYPPVTGQARPPSTGPAPPAPTARYPNGHPQQPPATQQPQASASPAPTARIPQVDGPSSSSSESPSPPASYAPRAMHPSLPQPSGSGSTNGNGYVDDEETINSDLDDSDSDNEGDAAGVGTGADTDIVFCTYDKVARVKNKWKCVLKDGMIHVNGKDYLFAKCTGEFEW